MNFREEEATLSLSLVSAGNKLLWGYTYARRLEFGTAVDGLM